MRLKHPEYKIIKLEMTEDVKQAVIKFVKENPEFEGIACVMKKTGTAMDAYTRDYDYEVVKGSYRRRTWNDRNAFIQVKSQGPSI